MAITNTLVMVQTGFPTGICVVRSRESNHGQNQKTLDDSKYGQIPRGRTPEPHQTELISKEF